MCAFVLDSIKGRRRKKKKLRSIFVGLDPINIKSRVMFVVVIVVRAVLSIYDLQRFYICHDHVKNKSIMFIFIK